MTALLHRILPAIVSAYVGGGLGNQLFDYAALRTLCDRKGSGLVLDASLLEGNSGAECERPLLLDRFSVRASFRRRCDGANAPIGSRIARRVREDVGAVRINRPPSDYGYFEKFWDYPARAIVRGHYLSPRFFAGNERAIRGDLSTIRRTMRCARTEEWIERIRAEPNPIMLHVRRGDLLRPENQWLRLPDIEGYMKRAVERLLGVAADAKVFVFTDDPEWSREWLRVAGYGGYVVSSGDDASPDNTLSDFECMLACRHFIMPNSAFSWWAAFLSQSSGERILPGVWDPRGQIKLNEVLMPGWVSLA